MIGSPIFDWHSIEEITIVIPFVMWVSHAEYLQCWDLRILILLAGHWLCVGLYLVEHHLDLKLSTSEPIEYEGYSLMGFLISGSCELSQCLASVIPPFPWQIGTPIDARGQFGHSNFGALSFGSGSNQANTFSRSGFYGFLIFFSQEDLTLPAHIFLKNKGIMSITFTGIFFDFWRDYTECCGTRP